MRLSGWRDRAPHKDALAPRVSSVVETAMSVLGAEPDPTCWVIWGDDPGVRYLVLAPTVDGLISANVRVDAPGDGPRASARIVRWPRVQVGELSVEIVSGHRLVGFQLEGQVLRGSDEDGEAVALFARQVFAAQDGRSIPERAAGKRAGPKLVRSRAAPAATKGR